MIVPARGGERARILSWPRPYPQNPYLTRLADALAAHRITTVSHRYLAALAVQPTTAPWLHLHWPEWMLRDASRPAAWGRAAWFFALIDAFRARGLRAAWTAHNLVGHDEPHRDLALRWRRAWLARCDVVFGHFESAEHDVRALGFRGVFAYAPHPNFERDHPAPTEERAALRASVRAALGIPAGERLYLAFGAIEPYKCLDALARTFRHVARADEHLAIVGSASSATATRAVTEAAAGDARIHVRPQFVPNDEVARWFTAADAALCTYGDFYTSGVAMLALTFGCPVVGPSRHHLAAFGGQPFFAACDEIDQLRSALDVVRGLDDSARDRARAFAAGCTWERMGRVVATTLFPDGARA